VALALSVPHYSYSEMIIAMTYAVVVFSVLIQGLTIRSVILKAVPSLVLTEEPRAPAE
jgi:CPA1 family monovalent cation:H+ antiporter